MCICIYIYIYIKGGSAAGRSRAVPGGACSLQTSVSSSAPVHTTPPFRGCLGRGARVILEIKVLENKVNKTYMEDWVKHRSLPRN